MILTADSLRYLFAAILNPFFISFMLLVLAIVWLLIYGDGRLVRSSLFVSFIGFLLFSTGWLPSLLIGAFEKQYEIVVKANPEIHWIVVLGGGHHTEHVGVPPNDLLTSASIDRLVEGVRLYRQLRKSKLVLSGGAMRPMETIPEASYLASIASWFDIPINDIVLETDSFNTADEAVAIKKILQNESFYLVTSAIHMPRAMALCRQQQLNPIAAPTDFMLLHASDSRWEDNYLPNANNFSRSGVAWHEILGFAWGKLRNLL